MIIFNFFSIGLSRSHDLDYRFFMFFSDKDFFKKIVLYLIFEEFF
jgi:hypothetical protein